MTGQTIIHIAAIFATVATLASVTFAIAGGLYLRRITINAKIIRENETSLRNLGVPSIDLRFMQDGVIVYMVSAARLCAIAQKHGCRLDRPDLWHQLMRTDAGLTIDCRPTLETGQPSISPHAITTT